MNGSRENEEDREDRDAATAGEDIVELACLYLQEKSYPADCTASKKRQIRQRAKKFSIVDGELFYKPSADGKVNLQLLCMHEEAIAVLLPYTILVDTVAGEVYPGQK